MRLLVLAVAALLGGCASVPSFIPGNENSLVTEHEFLCLTPIVEKEEAALASLVLTPLVKNLADYAYDSMVGAIEQESKLYKATYSARLPEKLLFYSARSDTIGGRTVKTESTKQRLKGFVFSRYAGDSRLSSCPTDDSIRPAASFTVHLEVDPVDSVLRLVPKRFAYTQSKAKVAAWDHRLDVNVQVTISAIVADKDGKRSSVDIVKADFPMGRTPIGTDFVREGPRLPNTQSGWFPVPAFAAPASNGAFGPVTVHVTVMEADNLGDVLARGAKKLEDRREKNISKLFDRLGLAE